MFTKYLYTVYYCITNVQLHYSLTVPIDNCTTTGQYYNTTVVLYYRTNVLLMFCNPTTGSNQAIRGPIVGSKETSYIGPGYSSLQGYHCIGLETDYRKNKGSHYGNKTRLVILVGISNSRYNFTPLVSFRKL